MRPLLHFRTTLVTIIVAVAITAIFPAWQFGKRAYRDRQIVYYMSRECHPVWKDLHAGRIRAGQSADRVIALTRPVRIERFANFVVLQYQGSDGSGLCFTGVTIIARDGQLIDAEAWSCTWKKSFFREWTDAEGSYFFTRHAAYLNAQQQNNPALAAPST